MNSPGDNTVMFQMKREFNNFLSTSSTSRNLSTQPNFNVSRSDPDESASQVSFYEKEKREKEAELAKSKGCICKLQSEVDDLRFERKRARIECQLEIDNAKTNLQKDSSKYGELQQQIRSLARKEEDYKITISDMRKGQELLKESYEGKLETMRQNLIQNDQRIQEVEIDLQNEVSLLRSKNKDLEAQLTIANHRKNDAEIRVKNTLRRSVDINSQLQDLEEYRMKCVLSEQKIMELQLALNKKEDENTIVSAMKAELDEMPELRKNNKSLREENDYLKNTQENLYLVEEELKIAKSKAERLQAKNLDLNNMEIRCQELESKLSEWQSIGQHQQSPSRFGGHVKDLQTTNMMLLEKQGRINADLAHTTKIYNTCTEKLKDAEQNCTNYKTKCQQQEGIIKRLKQKLLLVSKERDGFKDILDSYERDSTLSMGQMRNTRMKELESITEEYQIQNEDLERTNETLSTEMLQCKTKITQLKRQLDIKSTRTPTPQKTTAKVDENIVSDLRDQVAKLQTEHRKLEEANYILEGRLEEFNIQGLFDPTKTKVMHFVMNPFSIKKNERNVEIAELQSDNDRLSARVKLLQENAGAPVADLTLKVQENLVEEGVPKQQIEEMKKQLHSAELKNQRLMEVFKMKSKEFREICYQLLGYRIDMIQSGQYRVMNMYAESPEDFLLFQRTDDSELQLLGTGYSSSLGDKVDTFLNRGNSIPAFLGSLTIDLFNAQTMVMDDQSTLNL